MAGRERRLELPADTTSVRRARRAVDEALFEWTAQELADDAVLLTSELMTNVILHAATASVLVLHLDGDRLRIEVHDGSPVLPTPKRYGATATTGRGLTMVSTMAARWGAEPNDAGKVVWVELPVASTGAGDPEAGTTQPDIDFDFDDLDALESALLAGTDQPAMEDGHVAGACHDPADSLAVPEATA